MKTTMTRALFALLARQAGAEFVEMVWSGHRIPVDLISADRRRRLKIDALRVRMDLDTVPECRWWVVIYAGDGNDPENCGDFLQAEGSTLRSALRQALSDYKAEYPPKRRRAWPTPER